MSAGEDSSYTILYHQPLDSEPGRCLSPGARALYFDFQRLWMKATRNGNTTVASVSFTWTGCNWAVTKNSWSKFRQELVDAGFIEPVQRISGRFRSSERWRTSTVESDKAHKLAIRNASRMHRVEQTKVFRSSRRALPTGSENQTLPTGSENQTHNITSFGTIQPPLPSVQEGGGCGGIASQSEENVFEGMESHWAVSRKWKYVSDRSKELGLSNEQRRRHLSDVLLDLWGKRGDATGRWRITALLEKGFTWKQIAPALEELRKEKLDYEQSMKFLEHRARIRKENGAA